MSDIRKMLLTPIGAYMQDEDGQGWTLLAKSEEEAALVDESLHHLTNEEAEQHFQYEIDMERLRAAAAALCESITEAIHSLVRAFLDFADSVTPSIKEAWEQLRDAAVEAEEKQHRKPPRPDYKARPKCCTRAKTKRHRKQRSRER